MKKEQLRSKYQRMRKQISDTELETKSLEIANQLLQLPIWNKEYYHIFLPIAKHKEIDTSFILHILQGKDKNVIVPKTNFETNSLAHFLVTDNTVFKANKWGIPEPVSGISIQEKAIQVVFVPLLAYDSEGNRVGYGKGFYDAFLAKCVPNVIVVGVSLFPPEKRIEDVFERDFPLHYCVTPSEIFNFTS